MVSLLSGKINGNFILSNADIISDIDFVKAVNWHHEKASLATIISVEKVTSVPYGIVDSRREDGSVIRISEKPQITHQIISGLYIFESKFLNLSHPKALLTWIICWKNLI